MNTNFDIKSYRERWKAVEETERYFPDRKYNLVRRLLVCFGILHDNDIEQMQIMLRWAKIKAHHEQIRNLGY